MLTIYKNVYNNNIKIIDGSKTPIKFTRKQYSFVIAVCIENRFRPKVKVKSETRLYEMPVSSFGYVIGLKNFT